MHFLGRIKFMEGEMSEVTRLSHVSSASKSKRHDATIVLSYVALTMLVSIVIYVASMSPGTEPSQIPSFRP